MYMYIYIYICIYTYEGVVHGHRRVHEVASLGADDSGGPGHRGHALHRLRRRLHGQGPRTYNILFYATI